MPLLRLDAPVQASSPTASVRLTLLYAVLVSLIGPISGCLTIMIPFTFLTGVLTYVWPFVHTKGALIAIAVVYGCAPPLRSSSPPFV